MKIVHVSNINFEIENISTEQIRDYDDKILNKFWLKCYMRESKEKNIW